MFFLSLRFADSGELGNGTFSKCNNPLLHFHPYWLQSAVGSPKALPRGSEVAAATSADQGENVCNFSYGQPVCITLFCGTCSCGRWQRKPYFSLPVHGAFAKSRGHRNSPNGRNVRFLSRALHALLLCTYVPAIGFTLRFSIPPVRTYTAKHHKTHLYQVVPQPPHP